MIKKSRQKPIYSRNKKGLQDEIKSIFAGLSLKQIKELFMKVEGLTLIKDIHSRYAYTVQDDWKTELLYANDCSSLCIYWKLRKLKHSCVLVWHSCKRKQWRTSGQVINTNILFQFLFINFLGLELQKQPPRGVLIKMCSENMQQIYRRTPMPKCYFNKVALQLYWNHTSAWGSPVNLLHIFRTPFTQNTSGRLLLELKLCFTLSGR